MLALPLTLALQWGLQSRYLNHPQGVAQLAGRRRGLLVGAAALAAVPAAVLGVAGVLAGLLAVTLDGRHAARRLPASLTYAVIVLAATPAMIAGVEVMAVLAAVAVATTVAVALALRARAVPARPTPGRWPRAVAAGAIGAGLGLMLVLDRTVAFTEGAVPALALLPSTVASAWAGHHLRHLEQAIPRSVSGIAGERPVRTGSGVAAVRRPARRARPAAAARHGAVARPARAHAVAGAGARGAGLLLGFGLVALATLLVSLLEGMGRGRWALAAVACAAAAEAAVRLAGSDPFAGHRPRRGRDARHRPRAARRHRPAHPPGPHPGHRAVDPVSGTARRQRGVILASATAAGAILLVILLTTRAAERRPTCRTTLIPAYVPPHALVELVRASSRPRLLVINPASGPGAEPAGRLPRGGAHRSARAARACSATSTRRTARVRPPTSWPTSTATRRGTGSTASSSTRPSPGVARLGYYAALGRHVRAGGGRRVVVLNPGVVPAREYFDLADVIVTFEGPYAAYGAAMDAMPDWVREEPPGRVAHLVYDASRQQAMAIVSHPEQAGYVYATSGSMPDPWRTVPSYLHEEEHALEACA